MVEKNKPTRVVAPPLGWRFHRGVNPHEPPKSRIKAILVRVSLFSFNFPRNAKKAQRLMLRVMKVFAK